MSGKYRPLFERVYRAKKPVMDFLCPLCGTQRSLIYKSKLEFKNYLHIILITTVLSLMLYPLMQWKVGFIFFIVWAVYELVAKLLFRKNVPCPYCGFDATWYKRDVRVAKRFVEDYWKRKQGIVVMEESNSDAQGNDREAMMQQFDPITASIQSSDNERQRDFDSNL